MKKLITFMMSLLIMTTMMGTSIHADDTGTITEEGGSQNVNVGTSESVETVVNDVYRVSVSWNVVEGLYKRTDNWQWNAQTLKYEVHDTDESLTTVPASSEITITNYSNVDVDYSISFDSKITGDGDSKKNIASETPVDATNDKNAGMIEAAYTGDTLSTENTGTAKTATYHGSISYLSDNYRPTDGNNADLGSYSIKVSKHLALSKTSMTIKTGRTCTLLKASTPVTWSSSNTNVATVDENGKVTAVADGTAVITATSKITDIPVTCTVTVKSSGQYFLTDSQDDFDLLLATDGSEIVSYTDPNPAEGYSSTVYAYNGFIKETKWAYWQNALDFVEALNDNNVKPIIAEQGTSGVWRLLKSRNDGIAWAEASKNEDDVMGENGYKFSDYQSKFNGPDTLWVSIPGVTHWNTHYGCLQFNFNSNYNASTTGFVVIWQPTYSE